ncbi:hypothetical protein SDC9_130024 [bioreactor metagenome]|uniref:Uncharacterized protein n=1 Tax=bioreactor metagenome TaxID=1076179 RepID=A0A645D2J7_9ZZZZ
MIAQSLCNCQSHRQHHHSGRGVGHPHGHKAHGNNKTQNHGGRLFADFTDDAQRNPFMQAVLYHGAGQKAYTHQQIAGLVCIVLEQFNVILAFCAGDAQKWEQNQRQQGGKRNRHGLGHPENNH